MMLLPELKQRKFFKLKLSIKENTDQYQLVVMLLFYTIMKIMPTVSMILEDVVSKWLKVVDHARLLLEILTVKGNLQSLLDKLEKR